MTVITERLADPYQRAGGQYGAGDQCWRYLKRDIGPRLGMCDDCYVADLGWWCIHGETLLDMLREVAAGGDPDLVYAEHYVNSEREDYSE